MANEVEISIGADSSGAVKGIQQVQTGFGKMGAAFERHRKKIGVGLTALGGAFTTLSAVSLKSLQEEAIGIRQLDQALLNIGESYAGQKDAIEEVISALQAKTNFGDEAQRSALMDLISVSGSYEDSMKALPAVLDLAAAKEMDLGAAATLVARAIGGETSALTRYGIAVEKGADSTAVLDAIMAKFGGQAEAAADPVTQLNNSMGDLSQQFALALLPALEAIVPPLTELLTKFISWSTENPKLASTIGIIVAGIGGLALVMGPILLLLPAITGAVGLLTVAFGSLSLSMLPITAVVVGIAAAITAGIIVWKNWDTIVNVLRKTFEKVMTFIKNIVEKVFNFITDLYESKLGWLLPAGPLVKGILFLRNNWETVFNAIKSVTKNVTESVSNFFGGMKTKILSVWDDIVGGIRDAINWIVDKINAFVGSWNRIQLRVPRVRLPEILGGYTVGGQVYGVPQIGTIPRLANGGIVRSPTLAMIGERGPEAVIPLNRSGAGGINVNITVNGDIVSDDFTERVTAAVRDAVLGGGFTGVLARS